MKLASLIAFLLLPLAASAAERVGCPTNVSPADFQTCSEHLYRNADAHLDTLLSDLKRTLNARNWAHLKQSEVLWEKTRDFDCRIPGSFEEKPYESAVRYQCETELTEHRIYQLRFYLCPRYRHTGQCDAPTYQ